MLYLFLCLLSCQFNYSLDENQAVFDVYPVSSYSKGVDNAVKSSVVIHCYKGGSLREKAPGTTYSKENISLS